MSQISAVTARGHMRFMIKEKGGVNAEVFIDFLKRLIIGSKNKVFLIVGRGPAHVAKKTKAFVAGLGGSLQLFYLPPYAPDTNPDELVWKHLKADTVMKQNIISRNRHSLRHIYLIFSTVPSAKGQECKCAVRSNS
jgi:transposase